MAAFITGVAILGACLPLLLAKSAGARGPISNNVYSLFVGDGGSSSTFGDSAASDASSSRQNKHASAGLTSGRSVCVRLCDGAFFPIAPMANRSDIANNEESCSALCPDAPTALYVEPSGSDKIEDAVSPSGAPYTALPVALRYRTAQDNTCACHRTLAKAYPILHDRTLRKGDSVMTANGFMVFQGSRHLPYDSSDFIALAAASIPKDQRATLMAIERASTVNVAGPSRGPAITLQTNLRTAPLHSLSVGAVGRLGPTAASARVNRPPG
ncbi:MAG TPA: DUF2865 domain-containing protein [Roseiarcus sp.]|jgi:hypothetical protein